MYGCIYSFFNLGASWGCVVNVTPRLLDSLEMSRLPLYRRLGGPQARPNGSEKSGPIGIFVYILVYFVCNSSVLASLS